MPHGLDFPLTAQDIDGRLNGTAMMNLHGHGALRAYKFVRTSPMQTFFIPWARRIRLGQDGWGSYFLASRTRWEQESDSYYWQQRRRRTNGVAASNSAG